MVCRNLLASGNCRLDDFEERYTGQEDFSCVCVRCSIFSLLMNCGKLPTHVADESYGDDVVIERSGAERFDAEYGVVRISQHAWSTLLERFVSLFLRTTSTFQDLSE